MNKKVLKTISILAITTLLIFAFVMPTFASTANYSSFDLTTENPANIKANDSTTASTAIGEMGEAILNMVQVVAMFVAIIMLIVLAIKYISAAPNDKAEIKKHAVVYIVGAVVLFGATGILQIIKQFALNLGTK